MPVMWLITLVVVTQPTLMILRVYLTSSTHLICSN